MNNRYAYHRVTNNNLIALVIACSVAFTVCLLIIVGYNGITPVEDTIEDTSAVTQEDINELKVYYEITKAVAAQEPAVINLAVIENPVIEEKEFLGEFIITYYCSCKKCCGTWANNRPVVDGKEVVYTSSGAIAKAGTTVAVDTSKIPFGTTLYIEGLGYRTAQDRGGAITGNRIDVYMDSHEAALEGGRHAAQVYIVTE